MTDSRKKTRECMSCQHLIKCKGMPLNVDRCVNYEERKKDNGKQEVLLAETPT